MNYRSWGSGEGRLKSYYKSSTTFNCSIVIWPLFSPKKNVAWIIYAYDVVSDKIKSPSKHCRSQLLLKIQLVCGKSSLQCVFLLKWNPHTQIEKHAFNEKKGIVSNYLINMYVNMSLFNFIMWVMNIIIIIMPNGNNNVRNLITSNVNCIKIRLSSRQLGTFSHPWHLHLSCHLPHIQSHHISTIYSIFSVIMALSHLCSYKVSLLFSSHFPSSIHPPP